MPMSLLLQQLCHLQLARKLPRRSMRRYWLVQAARRELRATLQTERERRALRRVWDAVQAELTAMQAADPALPKSAG